MDLSWGDGDFISREAVLRGNLLTLGFSAVTEGLGRPSPGLRAPPPGVLLGAAGRAGPGPAPAGRGVLRPAAQQTCCLCRRKSAGGRWVEGPKWPLHLGAGRAIPSPSCPR